MRSGRSSRRSRSTAAPAGAGPQRSISSISATLPPCRVTTKPPPVATGRRWPCIAPKAIGPGWPRYGATSGSCASPARITGGRRRHSRPPWRSTTSRGQPPTRRWCGAISRKCAPRRATSRVRWASCGALRWQSGKAQRTSVSVRGSHSRARIWRFSSTDRSTRTERMRRRRICITARTMPQGKRRRCRVGDTCFSCERTTRRPARSWDRR